MNLDGRLNWILFAVVFLLIGVNSILFLYPVWQASRPPRAPLEGKNQASCLKVSDFYSVHLTTYFLASTWDGGRDPKDKAKKYDQYCDRIPGTGKAIFTVDLMEQDARDQTVVLSLLQYDSSGQLVLVKELPPNLHPGGVLTLDVSIVERGKYLLKLVFGEAKSKDAIIAMPILVGQ
jgi:hypothetical protein